VVALGHALMVRRHGTMVATVAMLLASGCAARQPEIYRWGIYEDVVYDMYVRPGAADPYTQIVKLSEDIERTHAEGKRVPPGVHAHLGYMYYLSGDTAAAVEQFMAERELFPESVTFIDGILQRLLHG
jgi:hypothetical protein